MNFPFFLAADAAPPPPMYTSLITFGMMGLVIYFLLIRPQAQERKRLEELLNDLKAGDDIVLRSGILGKVIKVEKAHLIVQIAPSTNVKVEKSAVERLQNEPGS